MTMNAIDYRCYVNDSGYRRFDLQLIEWIDQDSITSLKQAKSITGSFSKPSKMPCCGYGLPTSICNVGGKLVDVVGSVCEGCYANKGFYKLFESTVLPAQHKRLEGLDDPLWIDAIVYQINRLKVGDTEYFRWHDSGDLISIIHLDKIVQVCTLTPTVKHWLPTREYKLVNDYMDMITSYNVVYDNGPLPNNLVIRLSAHMVDQDPPKNSHNLPTSTVVTSGYTCPASDQDNQCLDCRDCWSRSVDNVAYSYH